LSKNNKIIVGNGHSVPIYGFGSTHLETPHPPLVLKNVLHAPNLIKNLVSVRQFTTDNKVSVEFDPFGFFVKDIQTGIPIMRCESQGDLYPITNHITTSKSQHPSTFAALSSSIWHNRLGHPGDHVLSFLSKNKLIECNKSSQLHSQFCHSCPLGKHIKLPFANSLKNSLLPFDILHSDVWTSPVLSSTGHKYYVLFLDDYSNFLWTFPMSHKSQVASIFLKLRVYIKTQFQREIKTLQCDNGGEYTSTNLRKICELNGTSFRYSCPYTSPQNGKAERKIRSINNIVRTLLIHASLPPSVWHHALEMATYISNIYQANQSIYSHFSTCYTTRLHPFLTYALSGVYAFHFFPQTPFTNFNHALHHVSFLDIRPTIVVISVSIYTKTKSSFVVMYYLTSLPFLMQRCKPPTHHPQLPRQ
jgi:transposase InsO family protein